MRYTDSLARNYEYDSRTDNSQPHLTLGKKTVRRSNQRQTTFKFAAVILFFLIGAGLVLSKNVAVTEQKNNVAKLTATYDKLVHDNKKAEIEINQKIDLKTVEEIAISTYNMNRAKKSQIVYINVQQDDYAVINNPENSENEKVVAYLKD